MKINKIIKNITINGFILFYVLIFALSIMLFWIGFHAVDLSYNVLLISHHENIDTFDKDYDMDSNGDLLTYTEVYRRGIMQMVVSSIIMISFIVSSISYSIYNKAKT